MAACSEIPKEAEQDRKSFTERVSELFEKLAHTGHVKPEPPLLVLELKALDLHLTEEEVTAAIEQTLEPTDSNFSHAGFLRFVACLMSPGRETEDTQHDTTEHESEDETRNIEGPANSMGPHLPELGLTPGTLAS